MTLLGVSLLRAMLLPEQMEYPEQMEQMERPVLPGKMVITTVKAAVVAVVMEEPVEELDPELVALEVLVVQNFPQMVQQDLLLLHLEPEPEEVVVLLVEAKQEMEGPEEVVFPETVVD